MANISGILINAGTNVWVVSAYDPANNTLVSSVETSTGSYTVSGLDAGKLYFVLACSKDETQRPEMQGLLVAV